MLNLSKIHRRAVPFSGHVAWTPQLGTLSNRSVPDAPKGDQPCPRLRNPPTLIYNLSLFYLPILCMCHVPKHYAYLHIVCIFLQITASSDIGKPAYAVNITCGTCVVGFVHYTCSHIIQIFMYILHIPHMIYISTYFAYVYIFHIHHRSEEEHPLQNPPWTPSRWAGSSYSGIGSR